MIVVYLLIIEFFLYENKINSSSIKSKIKCNYSITCKKIKLYSYIWLNSFMQLWLNTITKFYVLKFINQ